MNGLIDRVLAQVQKDIDNGDLTALEELLQYVPIDVLQGYLSEVEQ